MVRQVAYVHVVAKILLISGKNTKCGYSFSLSQERQQQTQITKIAFSTSYAQDSQRATKRAKKFIVTKLQCGYDVTFILF